jgi:glycosyltransferase involved in cell wall biosynthesis
LRILEIITPSHYSGAERVVTYLSGELVRQGHEVLVATKPLALLEQELERRGVPCAPGPFSGKFNPWVGPRLRELIHRFRPDLVHAHLSTAAWWGGWAAHREGIPCAAHVHAITDVRWYRRADLLIAPSRGVQNYMVSHGVPVRKTEVIYNGLDPATFVGLRPIEQVRAELGLPRDAPVIGAVAHLAAKKGHRVLLEAMARLAPRHPDLYCLCLGAGDQRGSLEDLARQLGLDDRVRFLGYRHDALEITQIFDVSVLPSVEKEGLGLCLLEAAFLGIPAAGSDAPGMREAVESGVTGLLSPPGDAAALAEVLDRLLCAPDLRRQLGAAAQARALERFTLSRQAEETVALFDRVLKSRRPGRFRERGCSEGADQAGFRQ